MNPDEAIRHALAQCAIYGEHELSYPGRVGLRIVVYPNGLQSWYIAGDPFEWFPTSADRVLQLLDEAYPAQREAT